MVFCYHICGQCGYSLRRQTHIIGFNFVHALSNKGSSNFLSPFFQSKRHLHKWKPQLDNIGRITAWFGQRMLVEDLTDTIKQNNDDVSSHSVHDGINDHYYTCFPKMQLRTKTGKSTRTPVCGDYVKWRRIMEEGQGVVHELLPRTNEYFRARILDSRSSEDGNYRRVSVVCQAANVDQMIIVLSPRPPPKALHIDAFIAAARAMDLAVVIVFNKTDMLEDGSPYLKEWKMPKKRKKRDRKAKQIDGIAEQEQKRMSKKMHITQKDVNEMNSLLEEYERLNITVVRTSCMTGEGMEELSTVLHSRHTNIMVGQSGVGKSSLLNSLVPTLSLATNPLHQKTSQGRHTTSTLMMYTLSNNSYIIDTPGVQNVSPPVGFNNLLDLSKGFDEFVQPAEYCKYPSRCLHINEDYCGVKAAIKAGLIHPRRYKSYVKLITILKKFQIRPKKKRGIPTRSVLGKSKAVVRTKKSFYNKDLDTPTSPLL